MADQQPLINEAWVMSRRNPNHGLQPIKDVLASHGNPQDKLRVIHVAGTNGKGSTCSYLKDILVSQGYKVGMFTSPHLVTHRDRIRINDTYISEAEFQNYLNLLYEEIMKYELGMFEIDTVIAFAWFAQQNVDYAIMECGLGGRLDNTNVVKKPVLELIASIGIDHVEILGHRKQQIAFEKAGIIKHGTTCISGPLDAQVKSVIAHCARRKQACYRAIQTPRKYDAYSFVYHNQIYTLSTMAQYQRNNCALALEAARYLGVDITSDVVKKAVKESRWAGRFETVHHDPLVILDGAHNEDGMRALVGSLSQLEKPVVCVYSALADKPSVQMAEMLKENCDTLIVTKFVNYRADHLEHLHITGTLAVEEYTDAVKKAMQMCETRGTVVITGSLYFISLVREWFQEQFR